MAPTETVAVVANDEHFSGETVDFSGKGLKLDKEEDAKSIVDAIKATKKLTCLILEGNTLGVDAAKAIGKALESQPHFERALWKDAFTGRLKDEIPTALKFLGGGLILANAHLVELDLSDNALGPVGMEGLVQFLKSPVCYSLKCLRLNNNGLGIYGGRMLAKALCECLEASKIAGTPLALKTFIVGRNRLENEGATALSEFFEAVKTLEEVQMPQNFIRHQGISALASALVHNPGLRILNLNDNTFTKLGSNALASALVNWQQLEIINFGDCLIRTKGAEYLAKALASGFNNLREVYMDHGEINLSGAKQLAHSLKTKRSLKTCDLNGNQFGEDGCEELKEIFSEKEDVLKSLSDDEGEPSSEEEESAGEEEEEGSENEEDEKETEKFKEETEETLSGYGVLQQLNANLAQLNSNEIVESTVEDLINAPTLARFNGLGDDKTRKILEYAKRTVAAHPDTPYETYAEIIMKVSSTVSIRSENDSVDNVKQAVDALLKEAIGIAISANQLSIFENALLVYTGLIKSEDKKFKPSWPLSGFFVLLDKILSDSYLPASTLGSLKAFFSSSHSIFDINKEETNKIKTTLGLQ